MGEASSYLYAKIRRTMQIVIYSHNLRVVSGIQTWEKNFILSFRKYYDITLVYRTANVKRLNEFKEFVNCVEYNGQEIDCDVCIYSSTIRKTPKIKAKSYIQVIHGDINKWDKSYRPDGVDLHVAVSEVVQRILKERNIESIVIPNIVRIDMSLRVLRLATISRIAEGKGFERIVTMAKKFKENNIPFIWEIYGGGSGQDRVYLENLKKQLSNIPEVAFLGAKDSVHSYIKHCDYIVQLSDHEGFCYSIYESLDMGIPVIVTNWDGADKVVKNGVNGYVLDMDLTNLDANKIYNDIPKLFKSSSFNQNYASVQTWDMLLKRYIS